MLSNVTVSGRRRFNVCCSVSPNFGSPLRTPAGQLRQRILASYHLGPLGSTGQRRPSASLAGWTGKSVIQDAAFSAIYRHSNGIPRKINTLLTFYNLRVCLRTHHISRQW